MASMPSRSCSFDQFLPVGILTRILEDVDKPGLRNISTLSSRLNRLALPIYISRCEDVYKNGDLAVAFQNSTIIPALRIALYVTSLEKVSCSINTVSPTTQRLRSLGQLFSRLHHVSEVSLDGGLPYWMFPLPKKEDRAISEALSELLDALHDKSCRHLTVNCWETTLKKKLTPRPTSSLQFFTCRSLTLFFTTFRSWTVDSINTSPITELILTQPNLPTSFWADMLPLFSSKTLTNLVINTENLRSNDLYPFLARHPQLDELVLIQPLILSPNQPGMPINALPRATTLMAHAKCIPHILAVRGGCPNVNVVAIGLEEPRGDDVDDELPSDLAALEKSITSVARRKKITSLRLSFAVGAQIVDWCLEGGRPGKKRKNVESTLVHITDFAVRVGKSVKHLPEIDKVVFQMLRYLPSLKTCEVLNVLDSDEESAGGFLAAMAEVSPGIEKVTIDSMTYIM